jgi:multiple sugar transport system ATP-binding protein
VAYLRLREVVKSYDGRSNAVDRVSIDVERGEFVTFLGPSGSGKTTTLLMIAGFETPTDGSIELGGHDLALSKPYERNIGMVFQNYALFPHMTAAKNVLFPLKMRRFPRKGMQARVQKMLELVGLGPFAERYPRELSGGQQQRVALARGLVFNPDVLLLDEPLGALDKNLRQQMQVEIKRIHRELGITMIYVTHDQTEAMTMGSRIAVMKDGKIQQVGTPLEIYDRPQNLFVANFIGTPPMNFIQATIRDGGATLAASKFSMPVPASLRPVTAAHDGRSVTVGIRPEHILDPSTPTRGEKAKLPAEVEVIEPLGDEVIVHARVGDDLLVYKVEPQLTPDVGQKLEIAVELDRLHLFDTETEKRLGA